MRTGLILFGITAATLTCFLVAILVFFIYTGNKSDASSKEYVDKILPQIISNWSKDELIKHASPEFRDSAEALLKLSQ
jgi:hypothetical protein